jgi:hypothetical protein
MFMGKTRDDLVTQRDTDYLKQARAFYRQALQELRRGKKEKNEIVIRDAAEKGWNAVVQATNYLFQKLGYEVPKSHFDRRQGLLKLAKGHPQVEEQALRDRYMAREQGLHEYAFYEGVYDLALLEKDIRKVRGYIADITKVDARRGKEKA